MSEYGSQHREAMKESMKHPAPAEFKKLNRRQSDQENRVFYWSAWVIGTLAVGFMVIVFIAQVLIAKYK